MLVCDSQQFATNVRGVFEAYGARPPTEAGLEVWFRTLQGYSLGLITQQLDTWPKRSNKAPTPRDIWQACKEAEISGREAEDEQRRVEEHNGPFTMQATAAGRKALQAIRSTLAAGRRGEPIGQRLDWADRIIDRFLAGDATLPSVSFRFACEAKRMTREEVEDLQAVRESGKRMAA